MPASFAAVNCRWGALLLAEPIVAPTNTAGAGGALASQRPRVRLQSLKTRAEFLRIRGGVRWSGRAFVIEGRPRSEATVDGESTGSAAHSPVVDRRFGFTVTKKIGNAVIRNRARRRLREAVRSALGQSAIAATRTDCDYVVVARSEAGVIPFGELANDMLRALTHIDHKLAARRHDTGKHGDRMTDHAKGGETRRPGRMAAPPRPQRDDGSRNR